MHAAVATAVSVLAAKDKPVDQDTNIVAGWTAFWIFLLLIVAVAVIGYALTRSLRTAAQAKDAGVYGDAPVGDDSADDGVNGTDPGSAQGE
ncbi:hypothetical protein [Nocardioides daeguensis]|uniref:Uncharacterized protein n=1 Tax=Nocardioides daeguensis TaxID=908359 RepID=A0ABP6VIN3_9ACTN|nr:hypothetical protein [Nocardioides daeguensis]MBV6729526.1 hypothetical protein [Nocardioides daeguensis]MCR1771701.1 hypothetical protein [Nocardioides daeguensis]